MVLDDLHRVVSISEDLRQLKLGHAITHGDIQRQHAVNHGFLIILIDNNGAFFDEIII